MADQTQVVEKVLTSDLVITRTFDAPRELVFNLWTQSASLERWYAPDGCTISFPKLDVRLGGAFHSHLRTPDGYDCWCMGEYQDIARPERLAFTFSRADEHGNLVAPADTGMHPDWPAERLVYLGMAEDAHACGGGLPPRTAVTVSFAEKNLKTTLTIHTRLETAFDREAAISQGFNTGWAGSLDSLGTHLDAMA